jgi:pimeloyl-ACP methyl ester carboxylesterase
VITVGDYFDINGHRTWVETKPGPSDAAETVVALHGGLSSSDDLLNPLGGAIGERYRVVAFDRRGHGRTGDTDAPFHYDDMATETIGVLETVVGGPAHLVGWSDGGNVGLLVALRRPDLVRRLVVIGANFHFDGLRPLDVGPDSPVLAMVQAGYAERSPDGADHFGVVVAKALTMIATEPTLTIEDLRRITAPTLVLVGDDDMIELGHTCAMYEALPAGQLSVIAASSHLVPMEKPSEVSRVILDFLTGEASPHTLLPARRSVTAAASES